MRTRRLHFRPAVDRLDSRITPSDLAPAMMTPLNSTVFSDWNVALSTADDPALVVEVDSTIVSSSGQDTSYNPLEPPVGVM